VTGSDLSKLEQGWSVLLSAEPLTRQDLKTYSTFRGAILFRLTAKLLGLELPPELEPAGEGWALVELARHSNPADAAAAFEAAIEPLSLVAGSRWPSPIRPLGMLAALARRDLDRGFGNMEQEGAPGRMLRMLRHRLTGR
jgi:phytoene synthase